MRQPSSFNSHNQLPLLGTSSTKVASCGANVSGSPAFQRAVELEPEIVMQVAGRMFLYDERQGFLASAALTTFRLGRIIKIAPIEACVRKIRSLFRQFTAKFLEKLRHYDSETNIFQTVTPVTTCCYFRGLLWSLLDPRRS